MFTKLTHQRMALLRAGERLREHGIECERLRSEEHTSELQSQSNLVCRLLLEKKKKHTFYHHLPYHYTSRPRPSPMYSLQHHSLCTIPPLHQETAVRVKPLLV